MAHRRIKQRGWLLACCCVGFWAPTCMRPASAARGALQAAEVAASALTSVAAVPVDPRHFRSQLGQDAWVLEATGGRPGYFMDMGARDGEAISNTYALERHGWRGVCVEPFPKNFNKAGRTCAMAWEVVTNHTGDVLSFVQPASSADIGDGDGFAGLADTITWPKVLTAEGTTFVNVTSISVRDFLTQYDVPKVINYWSLDIEGGEWAVLKAFPFCEYHVQLLTVEHASREPLRSRMRDLLEHHGFVVAREVQWDDWYINTRPQPGTAPTPAQPVRHAAAPQQDSVAAASLAASGTARAEMAAPGFSGSSTETAADTDGAAGARLTSALTRAAYWHTQQSGNYLCFAVGIAAGVTLHKLLHISGQHRSRQSGGSSSSKEDAHTRC